MNRCAVCHMPSRGSTCRKHKPRVDAPPTDAARVEAILDAIDLTVLEDAGDGWARFSTWLERRRNAGPGALRAGPRRSLDASDESLRRAWCRLLARVRKLGVGLEAGWDKRRNAPVDDSPGREASVRFTPEGRATLRRLVAELDAWLLSTEVA